MLHLTLISVRWWGWFRISTTTKRVSLLMAPLVESKSPTRLSMRFARRTVTSPDTLYLYGEAWRVPFVDGRPMCQDTALYGNLWEIASTDGLSRCQDGSVAGGLTVRRFRSGVWCWPFSEDLGAYFSFFGGFFGGFFLTIYRKNDFFAFFGGFLRSNFKIIYILITNFDSKFDSNQLLSRLALIYLHER